jgi:TetR/AcrR family transcriptional regulator, fatty acid biosynthesis regulator
MNKTTVNPTALTERGRRTQRAIMDAALELIGEGRSFNSLSMREVSTLAGVVPTAFYRHYKSMNQLGLAMVDDCGNWLRPRLRHIRQTNQSSKDIIRDSFLLFRDYIEEHPRYFLIAAGERHGGSPVLREAIRLEIGRFVDEMAEDLEMLLPNLSRPTRRNVCDLTVNTMLSAASEMLDCRKDDKRQRTRKTEAYVQQLRIIFFGADGWRDEAMKAAAEPDSPAIRRRQRS